MKHIITHFVLLAAYLACICHAETGYANNYASTHDNFIISSIPKAGTHLLMRCIHLMTYKGVIGVTGNTRSQFIESLRLAKMQKAVLKCHYFSPEFSAVLWKNKYRNIFICRDFRDACVSLVAYLDTMTGKKRDFFEVPDEWDQMNFDDKLLAVIRGDNCSSYLAWCGKIVPWAGYPGTLVVRFEDLVGEKGGGCDLAQEQTLLNIAAHTHMNISMEGIKTVAAALYAPTTSPIEYNGQSYLPGSIGNWKLFFNEKHKKAFKKKYNHLLTQFGYEKNAKW